MLPSPTSQLAFFWTRAWILSNARQMWEAAWILVATHREGHPPYLAVKIQLLNSLGSLIILQSSLAIKVLFTFANMDSLKPPRFFGWQILLYAMVCIFLVPSIFPQKKSRHIPSSRANRDFGIAIVFIWYKGRQVTIEERSTVLATLDNILIFHPANFHSIPSTKNLKCCHFFRPWIRGTPRYIPKSSIATTSNSENMLFLRYWGVFGENQMRDLFLFMRCLDAPQNFAKICSIFHV